MSKKSEEIKKRSFQKEVLRQMLQLATSSLGLVAALAWNEVIKESVNQYIKPLAGGASGLVSLLVYAVIVTVLAVIVSYNLARFIRK